MELKSRDTQTQIKHTILEKYLDTWAGIIFGKLSSKAKAAQSQGKEYDFHFVYVDCFAYIGRYAGDTLRSSEPVYGSPIIGVRALDKLANAARQMGINIRVNSILIEKDPKTYNALLETLALAGFEKRVRETKNFSRLRPGEIAVINGDSTQLARELVDYTTTGFTWSFYLIDPYGPSGIPNEFVKSVISQQHHDVMINFIYQDLSRKAGMARSDKVGAQQRQQVENWTAVFGDETWKNIEQQVRQTPSDARWELTPDKSLKGKGRTTAAVNDGEVSKRIEQALVDHYKSVLKGMDPRLAVKLVDLQFPEMDRTMFYLFLTTHDPTGALSLNKILYDAKLWEFEIRQVRQLSKLSQKMNDIGQLELFSVDELHESMGKPTPPPRPTIEEIASDILQRFADKMVTQREVYRELADEGYFSDEILKALKLLKKRNEAQFEGSLSYDRPLIQFGHFKS